MESILEPIQASTPGETRLPRAQVVRVSFSDGVPPKINRHIRTSARGMHASFEVLAHLASTIASMKALDHANTHLLPVCPDEIPVANKQR